MKKIAVIVFILFTQVSYGQTTQDTVNFLKEYSHSYLEYLFNKRDIDSAMRFWDKRMANGLRRDYSNHKQNCDTDSTLKILFTSDMNTFYNRVRGKIDFFACDDKEGVNIVYLPTQDQQDRYLFLINYDFWGDFECHNLLMRTSLAFASIDKGKTWTLTDDKWIDNYMIIYYFRKDYYGRNRNN
jgi:hypothetical protein